MNYSALKMINSVQFLKKLCNFAPLFKQLLHTQQYESYTE